MKNKTIFFLIFFLIVAGFNISFASEQFNFDVTEIEITEDGNKFKGSKKGTATTQDGLIITADNFEYDKILNILYSYNNVKFDDVNQKIRIQSDKATYLKNQEKIFTEGNSKAYNSDGLIITANNLRYDKILDIINAKGNVKIYDPLVSSEEVYKKYNIQTDTFEGKFDAIILAVPHNCFKKIKIKNLKREKKSIIFDVKSFLDRNLVDARL